MNSVGGRQVKVSRGRFLGGSSGVNGTLCIRGTKQDYDDWGMEEWTGDKMFGYMAKASVRSPTTKPNTDHPSQRPCTKRTGIKQTCQSMALQVHSISSRTIWHPSQSESRKA